MRKILLLLCIPFVGLAQTDYELEFNSATQDYVQMSNASSVIANKIAFSMTACDYPHTSKCTAAPADGLYRAFFG